MGGECGTPNPRSAGNPKPHQGWGTIGVDGGTRPYCVSEPIVAIHTKWKGWVLSPNSSLEEGRSVNAHGGKSLIERIP